MDNELINKIGLGLALVVIGALEKKTVVDAMESGAPISPYDMNAANVVKDNILKRANYQKPTVLQRIGLKKS